jgi:hypothetical protein
MQAARITAMNLPLLIVNAIIVGISHISAGRYEERRIDGRPGPVFQ